MPTNREWKFSDNRKKPVWPASLVVTMELQGRVFRRISLRATGAFMTGEVPASAAKEKRWGLVPIEEERSTRIIIVQEPNDDPFEAD